VSRAEWFVGITFIKPCPRLTAIITIFWLTASSPTSLHQCEKLLVFHILCSLYLYLGNPCTHALERGLDLGGYGSNKCRKWCCLPYSRYFLCSDSFREWLRICAEDLGIWLRPWALGSYVWGSIANARMRASFGIMQLSGEPGEKPGEKRKHCKASVKELGARRWEKCLFSF